jgi:tetratricopeptide (TPR) repeat protein
VDLQADAGARPKPAAQPSSSPAPDYSSDAATIVDAVSSRPSSPGSPPHPIFSNIGATIFHEGDVLGGRYEILKLLGMGGMGAVYKARDMEVERVVGLKVIRPDLAGNPAILARFKQELVLARQITHKNIVRIYDLNEADGVKFITMEFIEGEDLRTILTRHGKLAPEEAVNIIAQVCAGLQAAHSEGVIHRDLKPGNIMRDASGRVVIMDFGLARSLQGDGMTQTGMMIGTMEYMSPEQAMGKDLDARSDEFAVGLILYELLTGFMPYQADSAIASLVKRTQERVRPLVDVDSALPAQLSDIVCRCLEREPSDRFGSVQQLAETLEIWQGKKPRTVESIPAASKIVAAPQSKRLPVKWIAIGLVLVLVIAAATGLHYWSTKRGQTTAAVQGPVMSLAIVPFYNASGDSGMNWMGASIAEALSSDIGQSAHVHLVSPARLQQVLHDLGISSQSQMDLSLLKRIAEFSSADTIVYGQYERMGEQTRITATLYDVKNDHQISLNTDLANDKDLLGSMEKLTDNLREKLAANPQVLKELQKHSQPFTTKSIPALRAYDEGLQLARAGNNTQAVAKFEEATQQDSSFAMAFSKLAETYAALGHDDKAEQASRRAMELRDNLPAQDRLLIEANHAGIMHDPKKARAAYEQLAQVNPDDTDTQFALAQLDEQTGSYEEAKKYLAKVLASDPRNVPALLASGRVAIRSRDPQAALDPLNRALPLTITFDNEKQHGDVLQALGMAYSYLNKPEEALRNMNQALEIRKKIDDQRGVASSLGQIAPLQDAMGNPKAALASYLEAVEVNRKIDDQSGLATNLMNLGSFYLDHGKYDEALKYTNEALQIARDSGDDVSQAILLLNVGTAHYQKGEYQDAVTSFQQCSDIRTRLKLPDRECLHNLALTNVKLGQYDKASAQYLKALESLRDTGDKAGEAQVSTDMADLFAAQGRYDAALKAQQDAVDLYRQLNDRSNLTVYALAAYGQTLSAVGREDEGRKNIDDALKLAHEVNNDEVTAEVLNGLGDSFFYSGNDAEARQQYQQALQLAIKSKSPEQKVLANLNLAKLEVAQGRPQAAIPALKKLKQDADDKGLKAESVTAAIYLGEALLATNHADAAREELDTAAGRAEKLDLRIEQARAQYFLGAALAAAGKKTDAVPHYREAVRILESISKQPGAAQVLERSDLKDLYREAAKGYQGGA